MVDAFTNRGLCLQVTGSNVGTWGSDLNTNDITVTDSILGSTLAVSLASSNVNLTQTQSQNLAFALSGTLGAAITITLPLNFNSATVAMGGNFIFDNETTGAFVVTIKTVAAGSTGVAIPQGKRSILYSDGTNVYFANDGGKASAWSVGGYAGNPNGVVTCTPASSTTPADMLWDYVDKQLYICTAAPNTWELANPQPSQTSVPNAQQGYLTLSSDANNVMLTNDSVAATTVYYTPYIGNLVSIPNGSTFTTYSFSQLSLSLSSSSQAANGIYDVFGFVNSNAAAIGFGPTWATGGGSVTAGTCARGTGAGSTQLERLTGIWVNSVSITLNNGATTYSVGARSAIYLGSVFIDASAGQVSCYRTYGQSRKWGVWNAYNRVPVTLFGGDNTAQWHYGLSTIRPANGDSNNKVTVFCGLAEEDINVQYFQSIEMSSSDPSDSEIINGVGWNSTSAFSGLTGDYNDQTNSAGHTVRVLNQAAYNNPPAIGINVATALESVVSDYIQQNAFFGTESNMMLQATWRA